MEIGWGALLGRKTSFQYEKKTWSDWETKGREQRRGAGGKGMAHLIAPYLRDCRAGRVQCKRLLAELDDGICCQQHQGGVEEEAAHQGGPRLHGVHREQQQVHAHLCAPLDRHAWHSRSSEIFQTHSTVLLKNTPSNTCLSICCMHSVLLHMPAYQPSCHSHCRLKAIPAMLGTVGSLADKLMETWAFYQGKHHEVGRHCSGGHGSVQDLFAGNMSRSRQALQYTKRKKKAPRGENGFSPGGQEAHR